MEKVGTPGWFLQLKRMNTPTIYNGWEQLTKRDTSRECFNIEEVKDFMPEMGVMVGRAVTVKIEPSNPKHKANNKNAYYEYYQYLASIPGPKIVVIQDLDKPFTYSAFWGEVTANAHRNLGCVGGIIDGAIRDLDEMKNAGFHAIAKRLAVGHGHCVPIEWGVEVEVFGCKVKPNQFVHADKHGFLALPEEDLPGLLEASRRMDSIECDTLITGASDFSYNQKSDFVDNLRDKTKNFGAEVMATFSRKGEW